MSAWAIRSPPNARNRYRIRPLLRNVSLGEIRNFCFCLGGGMFVFSLSVSKKEERTRATAVGADNDGD